MRETEWGLQLQYVRVSLRYEAKKEKKNSQPISTVLTHPN